MIEYLFQKFDEKFKRLTIMIFDQFRVIFRRETLLGLEIVINLSQYRYIAIGISRRFLGKKHYFQYDNDAHSDPENASDYEDDVIDLQAGYKTKTAGITYARGILERSEEVFSLKKRFREANAINQFKSFIFLFFHYCFIYFNEI